MLNVSIEIAAIDEDSPHLQEVMNLAQANSSALGFLPRGAFARYAADNQILVALGNGGQVVGYLIYAISQRQALVYIVHLCTRQSYRHHGIATMLFEKLKELTKGQFRGVRVCSDPQKLDTF
jgi:ribosomal protein S18 acetylase RimI-like enzyme